MHAPAAAVETSGLTKLFGRTTAVAGIDLHVPAGAIFGLLGPNGAGKTTTIRMLATLLPPDAGLATVFGHDVRREADAVRSLIGLTGQFASVDGDLTGVENLVLLGRLHGLSWRAARQRAAELIEAFGLVPAADRGVRTYSGGMRRRLDVAAGIVTAPQLLFLDEPTTGLDPHSRSEVWALVRALVGEGCTVLLTTQYLEEADHLADRIAVIDHGAIVAEGSPSELKAATGPGTLRVRVADPARRADAAATLAALVHVPVEPGGEPGELVAVGAQPVAVTRALARLSRQHIELSAFTHGPPGLDEVFLALTGHRTTSEREDLA